MRKLPTTAHIRPVSSRAALVTRSAGIVWIMVTGLMALSWSCWAGSASPEWTDEGIGQHGLRARSTGMVPDALVWEDQFDHGDQIADGAQITTPAGLNVTFFTEVVDISPGTFNTYNSDPHFVSMQSEGGRGQLGAHSGYAHMGFDQSDYDPNDVLTLRMDFSEPVRDLSFSLLDIDGDLGFFNPGWHDGVELFFNETNVKASSQYYTLNGDIQGDDESYMEGFEGARFSPVDSDETTGNIDFAFDDVWVSSVEVTYRSTDDTFGFGLNPVSQRIGISDLHYSVPEPSGPVMMLMLCLCLLCRRRSPDDR
jgi:hypothetical protein